jgi:hypothetical protein
MDQQVANSVEQTLRQNWKDLRRNIQDRFPTCSQVDLDSAYSVNDLISRIADKSGYTERFVDSQIVNLVLRGNGDSLTSGMDFGQPGQEQITQPLSQPVTSGQQPVDQRSTKQHTSFAESAAT